MAVVAPFRALRYDTGKISGMEAVVAPPYDVISSEQQERLYQANPHNIIRAELNRKRDTDDAGENRYTRSAAHLANWTSAGVLTRDQRPCFYVSETAYKDSEGNHRIRRGFFTLLRLENFEDGVVLPHEKTFSSHKEDRLKLIRETRTNISPVFALYPDDENQVQETLNAARPEQPLYDFIDPMGLGQKLYPVCDADACAKVQSLMQGKVIFIADGHHRYETALNYRNLMREKYPDAGPDAAFNFVMVYLCSMSDPGLTVFACHRVVPHLHGFAAEDFLALARKTFDVRELDTGGDLASAREDITTELAKAGETAPCIGLTSADSDKAYLLSLKPGAMDQETGPDVQGPLSNLDVVVLTRMILENLLGLDNSARDKEHTITYVSDMGEVLDQVGSGNSRLAFLLNPTKVEQVQDVASAGLIMPRKSTYFYPKVLTGLTLNLVDPEDSIGGCS